MVYSSGSRALGGQGVASNHRHPKKIEGAVTRDLGEEFLVYEPGRDRVHVLSDRAKEVFRLCDGTRTLEAIALELAVTHPVEMEAARRDVQETVQQLVSQGLVSMS
jgi:hypothetical protein